MKIINYSLFDRAIIEHDVYIRWGDSLFELTKNEKEKHIEGKYLKAKRDFTRMMNASKNDGSVEYHRWAINTALKLKPTKVNHRSIFDGKFR